MRGVLVKVDPGEDRYVVWSSIVDQPVFMGSRDEILAEYGDIEGECPTCHHWIGDSESTRKALDRADEHGSSAPVRAWWWWDCDGGVYANLGWLSRTNLGQVAELKLAGGVAYDDEAIVELLGPLNED